MKLKKGLMFGLAATLLVGSVAFVGCGDPGPKLESLPYTSESISAKIAEFSGENGLFINFRVSGDYSGSEGNESASEEIKLGVNDNKYYFSYEGDETILDFSESGKFVEYNKDFGETSWTKDETAFDSTYTSEAAEAYLDGFKLQIMGLLTSYIGYNDIGFTAKGGGRIAGRECTKYEYSTDTFGVKITIQYWIEESTGFCLKTYVGAGYAGESASGSFECIEYSTTYTVQIPTNVVEI